MHGVPTIAPVIRRFRDAASGRAAILEHRGLAADGPASLPDAVRAGIRATFGQDLSAEEVVRRVIADVRRDGDAAVVSYTRAFDRAEISALRVPDEVLDAAVARTRPAVMQALHAAAARIRTFHEHTRRNSWIEHDSKGGALGQMLRPLERVAVYAPGGRAPYPRVAC